ncbi:MAG: thioether cross-link-forming SCIFF peptide maturase [Deferrisomatales bacterium]
MSTAYAFAAHGLFPAEDGALLFDADRGSLFSVDAGTRDAVERWRGRGALALDRLPAPDRQALEALEGTGILVPFPAPADRPRAAPDPAAVPLGTLVLEVAQACNLRCTYCYAEGGTYGGPPRLLEPARARRAARFLLAHSGDREAVTLVLFGGEPLLNWPAVRAAVEEARRAADRVGKGLTLSLTTNATRLTADRARFLAEHRVGVTVSLDGPPEIHDANRPFPDGRGSYGEVLRGLGHLLRGPRAPVAARVTLEPSQWARAGEVFDHLVALGFHEVGLAPASPVQRRLLPSKDQEDALLAEFAGLAARFEAAVGAGRVLPFSNLLDLLARIHVGQTKTISCGAGLGYVGLDASGRFFPCHRLAGQDAFQIGDLDRGLDADRVRRCLEALTGSRGKRCRPCWARGLCAGGCHYENYLREQLLGLAPGGSCRFIRRWLQTGIETYARVRAGTGGWLLDRLGERASC